jgi:CheY-like chemotaxis protein
MIANLDLLAEEVADNPSAAEMVDTILQSSLQGAEPTRQMLAFSRRQPLQPKKVDLSDLVANAMRLLTRTLGEHIEIELRSSASLPTVLIDAAQLEAALVNIAINARDAMPGGGKLVVETASAELTSDDAHLQPELRAGRYVVISLTDCGAGMTPEVLARVFEPFFTTKAPGKGTGLGLSMVYGFIKQSGGHVTADSEVGRGTTVKLYVPAAPESADASAAQNLAEDKPLAAGREVILAVDDNADVRAAVVKQLKELGYRVEAAENGETALAKLANEPSIELLLTDVIMPGGMNGKELARRARQVRPDLKVLFTSGFPGTSLSSELDLDSSDVLLTKPYRKRDLAQKIREVLCEADVAVPFSASSRREAVLA